MPIDMKRGEGMSKETKEFPKILFSFIFYLLSTFSLSLCCRYINFKKKFLIEHFRNHAHEPSAHQLDPCLGPFNVNWESSTHEKLYLLNEVLKQSKYFVSCLPSCPFFSFSTYSLHSFSSKMALEVVCWKFFCFRREQQSPSTYVTEKLS